MKHLQKLSEKDKKDLLKVWAQEEKFEDPLGRSPQDIEREKQIRSEEFLKSFPTIIGGKIKTVNSLFNELVSKEYGNNVSDGMNSAATLRIFLYEIIENIKEVAKRYGVEKDIFNRL